MQAIHFLQQLNIRPKGHCLLCAQK